MRPAVKMKAAKVRLTCIVRSVTYTYFLSKIGIVSKIIINKAFCKYCDFHVR